MSCILPMLLAKHLEPSSMGSTYIGYLLNESLRGVRATCVYVLERSNSSMEMWFLSRAVQDTKF